MVTKRDLRFFAQLQALHDRARVTSHPVMVAARSSNETRRAIPSKYPLSVQSCIAQVAYQSAVGTPTREDVRRAFAICISAAEKAHVLDITGRHVTPKGLARQTKYTPERAREITSTYETLIASVRKSSRTQENPSACFHVDTVRSNPVPYDQVDIVFRVRDGMYRIRHIEGPQRLSAHQIRVLRGSWDDFNDAHDAARAAFPDAIIGDGGSDWSVR